ncbi:D-alanyl-D-alanine carboxypeptidase [Ectothiorhodospiraceae bacterium BW-2]|nr:D-alanyl-D-alanine carboxypeptidase [Ectothiorhodospiraceae bacterium BW-2]
MRVVKRLWVWFFLSVALPVAAIPIPEPPQLKGSGYILFDYHSSEVIAGKNIHEPLEPASLTKLMTAYVVFHELKEGHIGLNDEVLVSEKAWKTPGSRMFIEVGKRVRVEDLIKGMVIQSGNDASVALAEYIAGSEESFASLMNDYAQRLGMENSNFNNSNGLPVANHYTTAYDMALLSAAIIRQFPDYYRWFSEKSFTYNEITQRSRNPLLHRDDSVDGLKTGHTNAAGYCLVASANRDSMRLITVMMGASSNQERAEETMKLLNFGFRFYETHRLYGAAETLKQSRIWQGSSETVALGLNEELFITIPRGEYKNLQANLAITEPLMAPVAQGERVGQLELTLGGERIASPAVVTLHSVAEGNLWQQLKDRLLLMFE